MTVATALGLWFGVSAPDISPVAAPVPAVQVPTVGVTAPVPDGAAVVVPAVPPDAGGPQRGGRR
jgi:hypothetical protein